MSAHKAPQPLTGEEYQRLQVLEETKMTELTGKQFLELVKLSNRFEMAGRE